MAKTIMVVDDEKRLVSLVESYLTQEGYHVVSAYNGKDALTVARREKPDLIVMGSHGHSALAGMVLGSVVSGVLARCKAPVLLIR